MASTDARRSAADARRVLEKKGDTATETLREALRANYQRGKRAGRAEVQRELAGADGRNTLLLVAAEQLGIVEMTISNIPNSGAQLRACREAAAILTDAANPEAAPEPTPKQRSRKKVRA